MVLEDKRLMKMETKMARLRSAVGPEYESCPGSISKAAVRRKASTVFVPHLPGDGC